MRLCRSAFRPTCPLWAAGRYEATRTRMFNNYADWEYPLAALQLVAFMAAMGARLTPGQFVHVLRQPRSFLVALAGHLVVIPLAVLAINHAAQLEAGLAAGMILVAAMPGGTLA